MLVLAALRHRLPRNPAAPALAAMAVLGLSALAAVWTSIGLPLVPNSTVTGATFEHLTLALAAVATVAFAAGSWMGTEQILAC